MTERGSARAGMALSVAAGLLQAVSVGAPWSGQPVWWLQLISLGALGWLMDCAGTWRRAALWGGLFATAWLCGSFWWLYISMHVYGGLPAALAAPAVLALSSALALYYAVACGVYAFLASTLGALARAVLFAALWLLAELARGQWWTGFGWAGSAYAHVDGPLAGYAPWLGAYGIAAVAAWLAMTVPHIWRCGLLQRILAVAVLALPSVHRLEGGGVSEATGRLEVILLQGNIPQDEKFQPGTGIQTALRWYGEQLTVTRAGLVVAPETAIPLLPRQLPEDYWRPIQQHYAVGDRAALVGVPLGSLREGYTNSVVGLGTQGDTWRYDKHHLVPFGEFIPNGFKWFTAMMNIPLGDFSRGALVQPPFEWQGQRLAPNICYEDLFGEEMGAWFSNPEMTPTVFVNASNIAWFGDTIAIDQHLHISRMRALEFERPVIRATNTGATAIIDHRGQVVAALPRNTRGVLTGEVEGRTGLTVYARWVSRAGLWPLWLAGGLVLLWSLRRRRA